MFSFDVSGPLLVKGYFRASFLNTVFNINNSLKAVTSKVIFVVLGVENFE